jgi:hypothetical protein
MGKACAKLSLPPMGLLSVVSVCRKEKQNILETNNYIRQNTRYIQISMCRRTDGIKIPLFHLQQEKQKGHMARYNKTTAFSKYGRMK